MEPKLGELKKWREMGVYSEVEDSGQPRISCRWVCSERLKAGKMEPKARLCARGCEDVEDVPTDSPTCERDNVRLILSIAATFNWNINSIDFKSAYLQGEDLDREIILVPPKEAETSKLWKLKKCVYGINDAGKKWYNELRKCLLALGTQVSQLDQAMFYTHTEEELLGVLLLHVDDTLWIGDETFRSTIIDPLKARFLVSAEETDELRYLGLSLKGIPNEFTLNLEHYAKLVKEIDVLPKRESDDTLTGEETKKLRILSGQLNWLSTQGRPDLAFNSCQVACSIKSATVKDLKYANKTVRMAKGLDYKLTYHPLGDPTSWKIVCFSDASFGNLPDGGSQGGCLTFLVGDKGIANLIGWHSKRLKRVARSTLAAETLACVDACAASILLSHQVSEILNLQSLPIFAVTDNESLANAVRSTTSIEDKRLRIEISSLREMLNRKEITEIKWVQTENQLADCLTKQGAKTDKLIAIAKQQMRIEKTHLRLMPLRHE